MANENVEAYESKAIISKISATSRASVKIDDSYYTLEYTEERVIPDLPDIDIVEERLLLWDTVNGECDRAIAETWDAVKNRK